MLAGWSAGMPGARLHIVERALRRRCAAWRAAESRAGRPAPNGSSSASRDQQHAGDDLEDAAGVVEGVAPASSRSRRRRSCLWSAAQRHRDGRADRPDSLRGRGRACSPHRRSAAEPGPVLASGSTWSPLRARAQAAALLAGVAWSRDARAAAPVMSVALAGLEAPPTLVGRLSADWSLLRAPKLELALESGTTVEDTTLPPGSSEDAADLGGRRVGLLRHVAAQLGRAPDRGGLRPSAPGRASSGAGADRGGATSRC